MESKSRHITNVTLDAMLQWVHAHGPSLLQNHKVFVQGLLIITEEAIREAIAKERRRHLEVLLAPSVQ